MSCNNVTLPGGGRAIVCGRGKRAKCCKCGRVAPLLCDWKVDGGTCDAPICRHCALHVGVDKDICPAHADGYYQWLRSKGVA